MAFTGKASCSALSSWRLTTSGSALANQAKTLSSRLLMLLMLKVAIFNKSLSVPVLSGVPQRNKSVHCSGSHYLKRAPLQKLGTDKTFPCAASLPSSGGLA